MREGVDKFEEGLNTSERLFNRIRNRTSGKSILFTSNLFLYVKNLRLNEMVILDLLKT